MLLTETISKSTSAVKKHRIVAEGKIQADNYAKALKQLDITMQSIKGTLECAAAMKSSGICDVPLMEETARSELLARMDDCGNGIAEIRLSMETVQLLKAKADAFADDVKRAWKDSAGQYSEGVKGYLSMIGDLSGDPKRAKELADNITKSVTSNPTTRSIKSLVSDVAEATEIVEAFSLNPEIELFLKKVSAQKATVIDLTPNVLAWLNEKNLAGKLRVRFPQN